MSAHRGKSLLIGGAAVALIVLAALAALLLFDVNKFKPDIEAAAFDATGLEVTIKGRMGLSFFPFAIVAHDVHAASKGSEIISVKSLKLVAERMPLLQKRLKVTSCELINPAITVVKGADGTYNFVVPKKRAATGVTGAGLRLKDLTLSNGVLVYLDQKTGDRFEYKDFNLKVKDLSTDGDIIRSASFTGSFDCREVLHKGFRIDGLKTPVKAVKGVYTLEPLAIGRLVKFHGTEAVTTELQGITLAIKDLSVVGTAGNFLQNIACSGNFDCKELRKKNLTIGNIKSPFRAGKGVFHLTPLTLDIFGGKGAGDVTLDWSAADAAYIIDLKVTQLEFANLQASFGSKKAISGRGDMHATLSVKEKGDRRLMGSVTGTFSLRGDDLVIHTMDLDKVLSAYETSQEFNLVDVGAFFIAGPLSTVALKGYRYGDVYTQTRGGEGAITHFTANWKIKNGLAEATDCALSTPHNRIALKGRLDLVNDRYDGVIVALVDDRGCAKLKQGISGSFEKPRVGMVSVADVIAGPFAKLFRDAKRFVQGGRCEVFYAGSVPPPRP